ncbi:SDR family oxidoreductase [Polynucleobacter sp. IMCC30063]|uniref:NAD-dependent epimerase/dehydratase family protein n=1 Tax=Polynucleobacter sp. IMCC30063 TaxID=2907298 RepID=UPI001F20EBD2|nr:SDR family oxidoreductase [Polynucleobacter sp. IMCC30063]MCE7505287.1 SDR family oxidoreductase [Polynucleobacter sp. IMCC30063]
MSKKIFITGGAGYVGAALVPKLLDLGYQVTVLDLFLFGENLLQSHNKLRTIKGDIRDQDLLEKIVPGHEIVIHLACISNDPSFELNPELGRAINLDAFEPLVKISKAKGVNRFIYASSSSVYGIKEEMDVHEGMSLEPLTDYSKFKADCEEILKKYKDDSFTVVTIRPATVCGYSTRQRMDVVVNILTNLAYHKREISVFGGGQLRPNIHISDMVNAYVALIEADKNKINGEIFNAGYENQTVLELAEIVKSVIGEDVKIKFIPSNDNRSYHISSKKINDMLGFRATHKISDAVEDLKSAFDDGRLIDPLNNEMYFNIKRMQNINLK